MKKLFILLLFFLVSCSHTNTVTNTMKTYTNADLGFTLQYPNKEEIIITEGSILEKTLGEHQEKSDYYITKRKKNNDNIEEFELYSIKYFKNNDDFNTSTLQISGGNYTKNFYGGREKFLTEVHEGKNLSSEAKAGNITLESITIDGFETIKTSRKIQEKSRTYTVNTYLIFKKDNYIAITAMFRDGGEDEINAIINSLSITENVN